MTDLNPVLQNLFQPEEISDDGFSASVTENIETQQRKIKRLKFASIILLAAIFVTTMIQFGITEFITFALTSPILVLGDGWLGWLLSPVNNVGALLALLRNLFRKVISRNAEWRGSLLPF